MSWGRIDDAFTTHAKILALKTKARKWTWLEVLVYTWKHDAPLIPDEIAHVIPDAKEQFLADCERIGLIERDQLGRRRVNDWELYSNASVEDKVFAYMAKRPGSSGNDVARVVGGKRELVLAAVAEFKRRAEDGGSPEPHHPASPQVPGNRGNGRCGGTHARAPHPSPTQPPGEGLDVQADSSSRAVTEASYAAQVHDIVTGALKESA